MKSRIFRIFFFLSLLGAFVLNAHISAQTIYAAPMPVSGSSCGGNIQWELVDGTGNQVERASDAQRVLVCHNNFRDREAVTDHPYQGYTFEVSWSELNPFRQRIAGATVFYNEDFAPSNLSEMIVRQGSGYQICTDYFVAGWAYDSYCDGSNVLGGCMNNFNLTCNEDAQRYWRPGQEPFDNAWTDILIPAATGGDPASTNNREEVMDQIGNFDLCKQVPGDAGDPESQRGKCVQCLNKNQTEEGEVNAIYTAVGCIRTGGQGLTEDIVRVFMGLVGGVALLSILGGAFMYTTSQGDSSKVKEAKALITAAVSGLFFIIFSIFILQFIGVSILRIPGLSGNGSNGSGGSSDSEQLVSNERIQEIEAARNEPQNVWADVNGNCVQCSFNDFQPGGQCQTARTFDTSQECSEYIAQRAADRQLTNSWVVQGESCYRCYNQDFEPGQPCAGESTFSSAAICEANRTQAAGGGSVEWYISGNSCSPCQQNDYQTSGTCASAYLYGSQEACNFAINEPEAVTPDRITCGHNNQVIDPTLQQCCPGMAPVQQADGNMLCGGQITFTSPTPRFVNGNNQWICPSVSGVNGCTCNFPDGNRRMNPGEICPSGSQMIVIQETEQPQYSSVPSTCALYGAGGEVNEYCWCGGAYTGFRIEPGQSCLSPVPLTPVVLGN